MPPSPAESTLEDLEQPLDLAAELRALIGCAVGDGLEPLMRTLREAVETARNRFTEGVGGAVVGFGRGIEYEAHPLIEAQ